MLQNSKYFKILNKPKNKKLRLFCFPYAGGSASIYNAFKELIGEEIELVAVQLPSRAERMMEDPFTDMKNLTDELYQQMRSELNVPFAFFGHSMGGSIAYDLGKKIEQFSAYAPEFIVISATRVPHIQNQNSRHLLDDTSFIELLRKNKASPQAVLDSQELMEMILPTIRADYKLVETYKTPRTSNLKSPVVIFNDEEDIKKEDALSWQDYIKSEVSYVEFSGGHFFIHSELNKVISEIKNLLITK